MKQFLIGVFRKTQKVLQVRIFADLLHRFTVGGSQPFLDDQCAQRDPGGLGHGAVVLTKLLPIGLFDIRPGNLVGQDDPAIVTAESAAKGKIEVLELQLMGILFAIHPCLHVQGF